MHTLTRQKLNFRRKEAFLLLVREIGEFAIETIPPQYPEGRLWRGILKSLIPDPLKPQSLRVAVWRLEKQGFLARVTRNRESRFHLTTKGLLYTKRLVEGIENEASRTPEGWDGKWRVVIFDVPERFEKDRRRIRAMPRLYDFQPLQKSVWISPWRLPDEFHERLVEWKLKGHILYLLTEAIDEETK